MGQYYNPTCIPKREYVYSHDYDNGLKLMEHSYINNNFVEIVMAMLFEAKLSKEYRVKLTDGRYGISEMIGSWAGLPFVWAGDYADPEIKKSTMHSARVIEENGLTGDNVYRNIYDLASKEKKADFNLRGFTVGQYFLFHIYNLDKQEYVVMKDYLINANINYGFIVHPLPLLTADGNGRGGGDFRGDSTDVGRWKKDRIVVSERKPADFVPDLPKKYSGKNWHNITPLCLMFIEE